MVEYLYVCNYVEITKSYPWEPHHLKKRVPYIMCPTILH